jgi:hypothetical protein
MSKIVFRTCVGMVVAATVLMLNQLAPCNSGVALSALEAQNIHGGTCGYYTISSVKCLKGDVTDVCSGDTQPCSGQCSGSCPTDTIYYSHAESGGGTKYDVTAGTNPCGTFESKQCDSDPVGSGCHCALFATTTYNCKTSAVHTYAGPTNCDG